MPHPPSPSFTLLRTTYSLTVVGLALLVAAGCGDSKGGGGNGDGAALGDGGALAGHGGGGGNGGTGSGGTGTGGTGTGGAAGRDGGIPGVMGAYPCLENMGGACAGQLYKAKSLPTDLFVMFDQSGSMAIKDDGTTMRIDAVRNAVDQFMNAPESAGLGIGIGYFGYQPLMCKCTSCDPKDYATPAVNIGLLPGQASAIMTSLKAIQPTGETPTGAAIRGACMTARARKAAEPTHNVAILLVTDGEPQAPLTSMTGTCNPTLDDAVAAATECAGTGISTYVLGVGPSLDNLNKIAAAGHTRNAYLVASGGTAEIVKALASIRSDAMIPCALEIPAPNPGATIDYQKVNVVYADASCKVTTFLYVNAAASCNAMTGGWYYDNPAMPKKINLCGPTCEQVKAAGGQLVVSVGCMTKVIP